VYLLEFKNSLYIFAEKTKDTVSHSVKGSESLQTKSIDSLDIGTGSNFLIATFKVFHSLVEIKIFSLLNIL
jgi:hypothetical protein